MSWLSSRVRSVRAKTALITGASGGIGLELARLCARDGANVILVARRASELARLSADLHDEHGIMAVSYVKDLSKPNAAAELAEQIHRPDNELNQVEILINNAGVGDYGPFVDSSVGRQSAMCQLNMTALVELTHLFLPGMIERGWGRVMNVASTAAFQPGPLMSVYYASKAFILHFSEAIANELEGSGVFVTALCPGPTATGFMTEANMDGSGLTKKLPLMDPVEVARLGYKGMLKGKPVVVTGLRNRLVASTVGFLPRGAVTRVSRYIQDP